MATEMILSDGGCGDFWGDITFAALTTLGEHTMSSVTASVFFAGDNEYTDVEAMLSSLLFSSLLTEGEG